MLAAGEAITEDHGPIAPDPGKDGVAVATRVQVHQCLGPVADQLRHGRPLGDRQQVRVEPSVPYAAWHSPAAWIAGSPPQSARSRRTRPRCSSSVPPGCGISAVPRARRSRRATTGTRHGRRSLRELRVLRVLRSLQPLRDEIQRLGRPLETPTMDTSAGADLTRPGRALPGNGSGQGPGRSVEWALRPRSRRTWR